MPVEPVGFTVTPSKLAFVLSLITFAGTIYAAVYNIAEMRFRLAALETSQTGFTQEVSRLSNAVTDLALALKEVQVVQKVQD